VRYGARDLAGRAVDTSVAPYRRCSAGESGDAGFLSARGAVLAELQRGVEATTGAYKVSASGPVRGVAQCVGGIPAGQCAACVSQAVAQLGGTCGAALAADVYLAQCSVRYWAADSNSYRSSQGTWMQKCDDHTFTLLLTSNLTVKKIEETNLTTFSIKLKRTKFGNFYHSFTVF